MNDVCISAHTSPVKDQISKSRDSSESEDSDKLRHENYFGALHGNPLFDKGTIRNRAKKAPKRILQQAHYMNLVEERIQELEKRLDEIQNLRNDNEDNEDNSVSEKQGLAKEEVLDKNASILALIRLNFEEYKPKLPEITMKTFFSVDEVHRGKKPLPEPPRRHLIEVVHNNISIESGMVHQFDKSASPVGPNDIDPLKAQDSVSKDDQNLISDRIRINSKLLLDALSKITGFQFTRPKGIGTKLRSQVMLRPFKLLSTYEREIRSYTQALRESLGAHANDDGALKVGFSTNESTAQTAHNGIPIPQFGQKSSALAAYKTAMRDTGLKTSLDDEDPIRSLRCFQELQVLLQLFDTELRLTLYLRDKIREGNLEAILYEIYGICFSLGISYFQRSNILNYIV